MPEPAAKKFADDLKPYLNRLYRAAYRLVGNKADAEDLVQDTCLRAFSNAASFAETASPLNWLMRVQYNLFVDDFRRQQRSATDEFDENQPPNAALNFASDPAVAASREQEIQRVQEAFLRLNKDQRALLALRVEGYSLEEICEISGLDLVALNSRLYRARQSLARHYRGEPAAAPDRMEALR